MEAQRYPDDFDGIVAGAPAYDFTNIAAAFLKNIRAAFPTPDTQLVRPTTLALVAQAGLDACDAADGVTDGLIADPASCRVPLDRIKTCGADVAADCITPAERDAIARIYAPVGAPSGEIYPGQPPGAEADKGSWNVWITGGAPGFKNATGVPSLQFGFSTEYFKYFVYNDATWDYTKYDMSRAMTDSVEAGKILNADSVDLSAFKTHGGKLIIWHGWADPALNAESTIKYYRRLLDRDPHAADYARLFLMPGVLHCGGGPWPRSRRLDRRADGLDGARQAADTRDRAEARRRSDAGPHAPAVRVPRTRGLHRHWQSRRRAQLRVPRDAVGRDFKMP